MELTSTQIAIVNAQDNSNTIVNYQMIDNFPADGINYYRLKMVDNDGTFQYSNIINVNFKNTIRGGVAIVSTVSYNPFRDQYQQSERAGRHYMRSMMLPAGLFILLQ